ncbi:hypothetical protein EWM64_g1102 [Hericium alpestre]|uniref:Importin N-terminal domain-containing protein n=1 Tax=Hericium alpestre TaxID=135208 RepID=A0A4Z0ABD8_9AGAM|nr:hypothetical protein EWM64_g1102 [Hericium alpestre]
MDLQTLSTLFASTISPNPNVQKSAELEVRRVSGQEGIVAALLQIIASDSVDLATRQSCAIFLKNRVATGYFVDPDRPHPDQKPIYPLDRVALKSSILHLLATSANRAITVQLAHAISSDIKEVHAGCIVALEMVRAFRFRQKRDILPNIAVELFPTLVDIASKLLASPSSDPTSQEIPTILHLILKTYKASIVLHLSPHQQSAESLVPWGRLLFEVVNLRIPAEAVPQDEDERERSEWWKAKKWAYGILGRLFHRFGNPSQLPSPMQEEYGPFAQHFVSTFAPEIFKVYLQQVELYVSGQVWLSKKCQYQIFQFLGECVKPKSTWALVKPHFETLVSRFVFPNLSFTTARQELWDEDPVDYVRTSIDEYENYSSPVSAATSFLFQLVSSRTKTTFMPILGFVNTVLASNPAAPQRFGALNMTAALGPFIMRHPDVKGNMSQFMMQHVLPEFKSPEGYMRAVACEVLGTVERANIQWASPEHLNAHFVAVTAALDDPELPVRVQAALALTEMVGTHEAVKAAVAPQVGKVIQDLLKLSDETDLDILNSSMESMVEQFQEELLPVAAQLTARLCDSYLRLAREALAKEEHAPASEDLAIAMESDDNDDKTYAAMGVAKTIGTIVSSIDSSPEILAQVQEVIIPIIKFTLENKLLDLFDNMYDLVDALTFKTHNISPNMWPIFELTYQLFKSDAVDFLDEMLPALDNFVSYGTEVFKARADYRQMMLDIYTTSITSGQLGENDRVNGSKLAESLFLNLRGHVDDFLQPIIKTALDHMDKAETTALRLANLEVLINAVLYNPGPALQFMEQYRAGTGRVFFDKWFAAINSDSGLPRVHDKKLTILALCALMELGPSGIPDNLKDGWHGIVAGALRVFKDLPKAVASRKALQEALQEEDENDSGDDDDAKYMNLEGEDEDVWDEDSAYIEMLAKEGVRLREQSEKRGGDEDAESVDSEDSDIDEELGYISPLDTVDPYLTFKAALTALQMKNGQLYQANTASLDVEQQTLLMEVMRKAEAQESSAQA